MGDDSYKVINVDINDVLPNRFQPRIQFNEEEILELSDSIKEHGVIQPLVVRKIGNKYEIIAGERRYKASVLAGLDSVPVIIKELNDKESAEIALIENIQRKNLSAIEEAISYKKIIDMSSITQEELAKKIGKSQSAVANKIRLLNLSDEVQDALLENKISERHARSLLRLKEVSKQNQILDKIIEERLTVRKTDEEINKILSDNFKIEKAEGKGEEKMNNESSTTPTVVIPPSGNFDIFGGASVEPVVAPIVPEVPVTPMMEPQMPSMEVPSVEPMVAPVVPEVPVTPMMEPQMPSMEVPSVEPMVAPVVPEVPVAPMMESQMPDLNSINPIIEENATIPELATSPIIVTDYSKQYDPIMPQQEEVQPITKSDFKEVINLIRECSSKIEQYGYRIDLEEYDLSTIYQVVFKIEK